MNEHADPNEAPLILGSTSPRRRDLLEGIRVRFRIVPPAVDERHINGEAPEAHVRRLALDKARDVSARFPDRWVLAADTIVVIDGKILGKPDNREHAREMLASLASRIHTVYTGYALVHSRLSELERFGCVASRVKIRAMTPKEIDAYISTGEPMDKAGSYAIQGLGSGIVESISGSYTNVVGLPLCEVARHLKDLGIFDFLGKASKQ